MHVWVMRTDQRRQLGRAGGDDNDGGGGVRPVRLVALSPPLLSFYILDLRPRRCHERINWPRAVLEWLPFAGRGRGWFCHVGGFAMWVVLMWVVYAMWARARGSSCHPVFVLSNVCVFVSV